MLCVTCRGILITNKAVMVVNMHCAMQITHLIFRGAICVLCRCVIQMANKAVTGMFGWKKHELRGKVGALA